MGKLKRKLDQSLQKSRKIPIRFQKNTSASLSLLLTKGAYKKRIKDLLKNNKCLASELEQMRSQVSAQQEKMKDYVKESYQIMYARSKLKDMASYIHNLVSDLDAVMGFLDINHLKNVKYNDQLSESGSHNHNMRMKVASPGISRIEESVSVEEDPSTSGVLATSDTAAEKSSTPDIPLFAETEKHVESSDLGRNLCDFNDDVIEPQISLTPVLDIQPTERVLRHSSTRNSRLSLKNAKIKVLEDIYPKRSPQLSRKKSIKNQGSGMQDCSDLAKMQNFFNLPSSMTQQLDKIKNVLSSDDHIFGAFKNVSTFQPADSITGDTTSFAQKITPAEDKAVSLAIESGDAPEFSNKIDQTLVMCEDMELTDIIPTVPMPLEHTVSYENVYTDAVQNKFHNPYKNTLSENVGLLDKHKKAPTSQCEKEAYSEEKSYSENMPCKKPNFILNPKGLIEQKSVLKNSCNKVNKIKESVMDDVQSVEQMSIEEAVGMKQRMTIQTHENIIKQKPEQSNRKSCFVEQEVIVSTASQSPKVRKQNQLNNKTLSSESKPLTPELEIGASNAVLLEMDKQKNPEIKTTINQKLSDSFSLEPINAQQVDEIKTLSISNFHEYSEKKDTSCTESPLNPKLRHSKNVDYHIFFSSDSDSDISIPSSPISSRKRVLSGRNNRRTVIHLKKSNGTTPKYNDRKSDKITKDKKRFPTKQSKKSNSLKSVNSIDSTPSFNSESDEDLVKSNLKEKKIDANEGENLPYNSENCSILKKRETILERKRVSFAPLDSVYKFQRNSAVICTDKLLTLKSAKSVSNNYVESDSFELMGEKGVAKDDEKEKFLALTQDVIKEDTVVKKTNECENSHEKNNQSNQNNQSTEDKAFRTVGPFSLVDCAASELNEALTFDDETEIYTFALSNPQEVENIDPSDHDHTMVTIRRGTTYECSFDVSGSDLQENCASKLISKPALSSEINQNAKSLENFTDSSRPICDSYQAKQKVISTHKPPSPNKAICSPNSNHEKNLCSKTINAHKSSQISNLKAKQHLNDEKDTSVTGLSCIISELLTGQKADANRRKNIVPSSDCIENGIQTENIPLNNGTKKSNYRNKSSFKADLVESSKGKATQNCEEQPQSPEKECILKHKNVKTCKKSGTLKSNSKENKMKSEAAKEKKDKIPTPRNRKNTLELKDSLPEESRISNNTKKRSTHSGKILKVVDENLPCLRDSLNNDRPKRNSKPVTYAEPKLNKKMRREH